MTNHPERKKLFDEWAETYDQDLQKGDSFPFIGYDAVLALMIKMADVHKEHIVLDLGIGTGNLARRMSLPEEQIWGVDFSQGMLDKAQAALPGTHLIQTDLSTSDWVNGLCQRFDCIFSAYTFHEFSDEEKVALIMTLAEKCLIQGGRIVIGDISFMNSGQLAWGHRQFTDLWDDEEYYWCAEPLIKRLHKDGFYVKYEQVSVCAGVYRIQVAQNLTSG